MKRIIYLCSIFFLLVSCQKKLRNNYPTRFVKKRNVSIPIKAYIAPQYSEIQYLARKNQVIVANRMGKQMLYKIDLKKEKIVEELEMDQTGPNDKNQNYRLFYYWNRDSIFLIGIYDKKFYLINKEGIIKSSYTLDIKTPDIELSNPAVMMGVKDGVYNNKTKTLSFTALPPSVVNLKSFPNSPVFFHLNLRDSVITAGIPTYGLNYEEGTMEHPVNMAPIVTGNGKNQMVFVFSTQPAIYKYDLESGSIEKHPFQSDHVKKYPRLKDIENMYEYLLECNDHERILFNEKLGIYLLFIDLYTPYVNEDTGKKNTYNSKPISILVFNEEFEKIAEKKFPGNTYNVYNSFLTDEGLYLSTSNPYNPNFTEDALTYEFYKIVQK